MLHEVMLFNFHEQCSIVHAVFKWESKFSVEIACFHTPLENEKKLNNIQL